MYKLSDKMDKLLILDILFSGKVLNESFIISWSCKKFAWSRTFQWKFSLENIYRTNKKLNKEIQYYWSHCIIRNCIWSVTFTFIFFWLCAVFVCIFHKNRRYTHKDIIFLNSNFFHRFFTLHVRNINFSLFLLMNQIYF